MSDGSASNAIVPIVLTGLLVYEGNRIMRSDERKRAKHKKAHLERKRSKGKHKLKEIV